MKTPKVVNEFIDELSTSTMNLVCYVEHDTRKIGTESICNV